MENTLNTHVALHFEKHSNISGHLIIIEVFFK